jgi:cobalt-zinc-cadmium efflux system membrane fusion protein
MNLYKTIGFVSCLLLSTACQNTTETHKEHDETEEHHEESNIVSLSDEQIKTAGVVLGKIEMKNLTSSISVNGTLAVPNQNKALVTSLIGGVLQTLKVQPGNTVHKGQVIGTIANTEISGIQQHRLSIIAQLKYAELEQKRQSELVAGNAAPMKNLQKVESELSSLKSQLNALQQQLSALGVSLSGDISSTITITAPISGTISVVTAQIGSNINSSTPIAEIINNSELHLDLFVYEKDLPKVKAGQTIHFTLTNNPGIEYDAAIYSIGTAFVNESKAIPVHAKVINDKTGLIEGMGVTARISLGENVYPAVPEKAIINNGGKDYIFIITNETNTEEHHHEEEGEAEHVHNTSFQRVQVIKGASDVGYTEITPITQLPDGVQIVVDGAFFLMAKMTNAGEAHAH